MQEAAERDLQKESDALTLAIAAAKEDLESTVKEIASTTNRTMNSEIKGLEEDIKDIINGGEGGGSGRDGGSSGSSSSSRSRSSSSSSSSSSRSGRRARSWRRRRRRRPP